MHYVSTYLPRVIRDTVSAIYNMYTVFLYLSATATAVIQQMSVILSDALRYDLRSDAPDRLWLCNMAGSSRELRKPRFTGHMLTVEIIIILYISCIIVSPSHENNMYIIYHVLVYGERRNRDNSFSILSTYHITTYWKPPPTRSRE